jgi:DNA repair protein RadC
MNTYKSHINQFQISKLTSDIPKAKIHDSRSAADYIRQFYSDDIEIFESVFILLLNRANNTIGYAKISQGGVSGTVVDPKIVAYYAINSLASGVILAHNHPSGELKPSRSDHDLTKKIKDGLRLLDVTLLDHLILTADKHFSFVDEGVF